MVTTLTKGMIGYEVTLLQRALNKVFGDTALAIDGHFGPKVEYYVQQFQKKSMLVVDGVAGPKTLWALGVYVPSLAEGKTPDPAPAIPQPSPTLPLLGLDKDYPPFAVVLKQKMIERGRFELGSCRGLQMHFTAGWDGAEKTINGGIENKYTYWCAQRDGTLYCASRADYWGYHAGQSGWTMLTKKLVGSVSDDLLGMEMNAFGRVDPIKGKPGKYITWFKHEVDQSEVRYSPTNANILGGYYHVYTDAQILTYIKTAMWLKLRKPLVFDFDYCLGHDEVSGPTSGITKSWRKNDPGASLPWTMPKFREGLKQFYVEYASKPAFTFADVTMDNFKKCV